MTSNMTNGSLTLVGSGIKFLSHITHETVTHIQAADIVVYLSNDPIFCQWIQEKNPSNLNLSTIYYSKQNRKESYAGISDHVVSLVESGSNVCFVIYGHPVVFSQPGLDAAKRLRKNGYIAKILPAISAEDCLFADLLIDPGSKGCLSYEATDLLLYDRPLCPSSHLVVWQISAVGILTHKKSNDYNRNIILLRKKLLDVYPCDHEVIIYVAAKYPGFEPQINRVNLTDLGKQEIHRFASLYVTPSVVLAQKKGILEEFTSS